MKFIRNLIQLANKRWIDNVDSDVFPGRMSQAGEFLKIHRLFTYNPRWSSAGRAVSQALVSVDIAKLHNT